MNREPAERRPDGFLMREDVRQVPGDAHLTVEDVLQAAGGVRPVPGDGPRAYPEHGMWDGQMIFPR